MSTTCWFRSPTSGEQALEITEALVRSGAIDVLVVDSVAALVPKAELDGEMGDSHMGLQARLMSQALRKLTGTVSKSRTALIFINQIREKIGVMFGNPETTTGGRALKFYSSVRVDIRRIAAVKEGDTVTGIAHQGQDRQEQGGRAFPRGRVRHSLRRRHQPRRRRARSGGGATTSWRSPARGTATRASASARAAKTRAHFLKENKDIFAQDGRRAAQEAEHRRRPKAEVPEVPVTGHHEAKEAVRARR